MLKKVAILRGGQSRKRQESLEFGKNILDILNHKKYNNHIIVNDLIIHPNGAWSLNGKLQNPEEIIEENDLFFNALIGEEAESGQIIQLLENNNKAIISHSSLHSKITHNKKELHSIVTQHYVKTPYNKIVTKETFNDKDLIDTFKHVGIPSIIKPTHSSHLFLVNLINNYDEAIRHANKIIENNYDVLIEQFIKGILVSVFIYESNNAFNIKIYLHNQDDNKHINKNDIEKVKQEALKIHYKLGFTSHVEYDFIYNKNGIYLIEINTHPSLIHDHFTKILDKQDLENYIDYQIKKHVHI